MYLPRPQIAQLYTELVRNTHPLSPPILILTALTVDSLCATRILTALLKRDYIPHKVQPVSGYGDLARAGRELVLPLTRQKGGEGGVVVCLGVAGLIDVEEVLGLDGQSGDDEEGAAEDMREHGVEVWVVDGRRPWNLQDVFGSTAAANAGEETAALATTARSGVEQGRLLRTYRAGKGGVIVWDDGDIETELAAEKEAFLALQDMPEISEEDVQFDDADARDESDNADEEEPSSSQGRKRKLRDSDDEDDAGASGSDSDENERPRQRRRSNGSTPIPSSPGGNPRSAQMIASTPPTSSQQASDVVMPSSPPQPPSQRQMRRQLLKERRRHEATLDAYYNLGTSHSEPVSSMLYSLASELGREDNDLLWVAIVGISSVDLSPLSNGPTTSRNQTSRRILSKPEQIKEVLRDEVRRLNPIPDAELRRNPSGNDSVIPTHARSPTDNSIRLSPEPKFLLIRHWSLYDSMYHSPFLSTRLHIWSEAGVKRLHKLLAKMGISLQEAGKGYVHMDLALKQTLRQRILKFAEMYNLEGLVPGDDGRSGQEGWGFVRSWGWKATLSAVDVAMVVSAILEIGPDTQHAQHGGLDIKWDGNGRSSGGSDPNYNSRVRALPTPPHSEDGSSSSSASQIDPSAVVNPDTVPDWTVHRFFAAYDALNPSSSSSASHSHSHQKQGLPLLLANITTAQHLHRAILRAGSALISKKQIRHLRSFRMGVVKEGPDVALFTHPGALAKLGGWVRDAVAVLEAEKHGGSSSSSGGSRSARGKGDEALVLGCLDEGRGVYVVVGLGGQGGGGGGKVRSKAEIKEREEKRKRKMADREAEKAEKARKKEERRIARREMMEANGILDSDDEDDEDEDEDESEDGSNSSDSDDSASDADDSDDDDGGDGVSTARRKRGYGLNRFGQAFQEVVEETAARVRIDSFEHSVVEVRKEDLAGFLEKLSLKSVVG